MAEKKRLTKAEIALRQELANTIHDMDDGKLESSRLHTLQTKINNKLYDNESYEDEEEYEEEIQVLPTVSYSYDDYVDNIDYMDTEDISYTLEDSMSDIRCAIENLACCTSEKKVPGLMKKVEKEFTNFNNAIKSFVKDSEKDSKSSMASAAKQLKKLKADVAKDLKKAKVKKNANKSTLL